MGFICFWTGCWWAWRWGLQQMAAMVETSSSWEVLCSMPISRWFSQEWMQYVLSGLYEWGSLFHLPRSSSRPSRDSGGYLQFFFAINRIRNMGFPGFSVYFSGSISNFILLDVFYSMVLVITVPDWNLLIWLVTFDSLCILATWFFFKSFRFTLNGYSFPYF